MFLLDKSKYGFCLLIKRHAFFWFFFICPYFKSCESTRGLKNEINKTLGHFPKYLVFLSVEQMIKVVDMFASVSLMAADWCRRQSEETHHCPPCP